MLYSPPKSAVSAAKCPPIRSQLRKGMRFSKVESRSLESVRLATDPADPADLPWGY